MLVYIVENRKAVDDELARPKLVGSQKNSGGISAGRRIAGGERRSDHFRRRVLSVEKVVRPHRPVVVHIENALSLQSLEHSMRLGHAFLVIKHVLKAEDAPFLSEGQTRGAILLAFEGL